jgi:predicted nuclease of predicted toxin-antitoxin system
MNFLLDENFPRPAVPLVEAAGHRAYSVLDFEPPGASDETVFRRAQCLGAVLLSTDKDFFHTVPFLFGSHAGVVVVSLRQPNRQALLARLTWFLAFMPHELSNKVYMLRDSTFVTAR